MRRSRRRRPASARSVPAAMRWWCRSGTATACSSICRSRTACCRRTRSSDSPPSTPSSGAWRVFSTLADGQVVQVAQPMSARRELATSMALRTVVPLLLALPVLALLIWLTIARGLAPLDRVAAAVERRSPALLEPLSESGLPREVQPLVGALNGLLGRLGHALDAQRSFIADAAHELRTPLTAVHLQAQLAERATTDAERRAALADLEGRARARDAAGRAVADPGARGARRRRPPAGDGRPCRRSRASVVAELAPLAAAKRIDLGLNADSAACRCAATPTRWRRCCRTSSTTRCATRRKAGESTSASRSMAGARVLSVRDSGPGIPEADRERVFDRFVRGSVAAGAVRGSGLGLVDRQAHRRAARRRHRRRAGPGRRRRRASACASRLRQTAPPSAP